MGIQRAGCLAALGVGLAVSLAMAEPPARKSEPASGGGWLSSLFGGKSEPPPKKATPTARPPITVADRDAEMTRLLNAYLRRLAVCDELRQIALETDNRALEEEAMRLDELASRIYKEQSSKLLGVAMSSTESDEPGDKGPVKNSGRVLRGSSPGGMLPQRIWSGGRIEPEQSARGREGKR